MNNKKLINLVKYYHDNIDSFVEDFLGCKLTKWQKWAIKNIRFKFKGHTYMYFKYNPYLPTIVTTVCYCILHPDRHFTVINTSPKHSNKDIFDERILGLFDFNDKEMSNEIDEINDKDCYIKFKNGSSITAIKPSEEVKSVRSKKSQ